jgi:dTDP-4-amino-4,6-dideoxygalactose transaminase
LLKAKDILFNSGINTRRYFYPSLNNLPFLTEHYECPVSEDISKRVLCLPLYFDLEKEIIEKIAKVINSIS